MLRTMCLTLLCCASCASPKTPPPTTPNKPKLAPKAAATAARVGKWAIRGTKLFVRDVGPKDAPVLLVVHGGPGGNHNSLRTLEVFSPAYRVVLYDQRGTGESDRLEVSPKDPGSLKRLSLRENVEDIEALRKRLGREKITLLGHSWGGALAVFYAAAYPQHVEKLVVYSGGPETAELSKRKRGAHHAKLTAEEKTELKAGTKALVAALRKGATQDELDERVVKLASLTFGALNCQRPKSGDHGASIGRGGFWANQIVGAYVRSFKYADIAPGLAKLEAPTLLIWGKCEPSPIERLTNLLDLIPEARLAIFAKSGHNAMNEQKPLFFASLRAFLSDKKLPMKTYAKRADVPPAKP